MMENGCFNNWNFRECSYIAGKFCSLETGIPGGHERDRTLLNLPHSFSAHANYSHIEFYRITCVTVQLKPACIVYC